MILNEYKYRDLNKTYYHGYIGGFKTELKLCEV